VSFCCLLWRRNGGEEKRWTRRLKKEGERRKNGNRPAEEGKRRVNTDREKLGARMTKDDSRGRTLKIWGTCGGCTSFGADEGEKAEEGRSWSALGSVSRHVTGEKNALCGKGLSKRLTHFTARDGEKV